MIMFLVLLALVLRSLPLLFVENRDLAAVVLEDPPEERVARRELFRRNAGGRRREFTALSSSYRAIRLTEATACCLSARSPPSTAEKDPVATGPASVQRARTRRTRCVTVEPTR